MDRFEKVNRIKKIEDIIKHCNEKIAEYKSKIAEIENYKNESKKELIIKDIIKHCNEKIAEYKSKIAEIENYKWEAQEELIRNSKSELTVFMGTRKSKKTLVAPIDIYYDVDLGLTRTIADTSKRATADVNLEKFFSHYLLNRKDSYYKMIGGVSYILEAIINDMFSKKIYNSWNEVKEDLLKINEMYDAPQFDEKLENYKKRVLEKNNSKE